MVINVGMIILRDSQQVTQKEQKQRHTKPVRYEALFYLVTQRPNITQPHSGGVLSQGGGGVLGSSFAGYVPLASQNPYPIIVYFWSILRLMRTPS